MKNRVDRLQFIIIFIQLDPENCRIGGRLLEWIYDFKQSNEHKTFALKQHEIYIRLLKCRPSVPKFYGPRILNSDFYLFILYYINYNYVTSNKNFAYLQQKEKYRTRTSFYIGFIFLCFFNLSVIILHIGKICIQFEDDISQENIFYISKNMDGCHVSFYFARFEFFLQE